jgi:signal transduction histidine kinase
VARGLPLAGILALLLAAGGAFAWLGVRAVGLERSEAGREARARAGRALEEAAEHLERSAEDPPAPSRATWLLDAAPAPAAPPAGEEGFALFAREAAHRMRHGDAAGALPLFERALAAAPPDAERPRLLLDAGTAAWRTGDGARALGLWREAAASPEEAVTAEGAPVRTQALYLLARAGVEAGSGEDVDAFLAECDDGARLGAEGALGCDGLLLDLAARLGEGPADAPWRARLLDAAARAEEGRRLRAALGSRSAGVVGEEFLRRDPNALSVWSFLTLTGRAEAVHGLRFTLEPAPGPPEAHWEKRALAAPFDGAVMGVFPEAGGPGAGGLPLLLLAGLGVYALGCLLLVRALVRSRRAARMQSDFVAAVSHELKTPIASVRAMAEALGDGAASEPERARAYAQRIEAEMRRLGRTVRNVLDAAQIERLGGLPVRLAPGDPAEVVRRVGEAFAPTLERRGFTFAWSAAPVPTPVPLDAEALQGVLMNLVDNAAKFSSARKEVEVVGTAPTPGGYRVEVRDRGPGVGEAERARLFRRFERGEPARAAAVPGVGLGLHVAAQVVREHGGTLRHEPRAGGGSVFVVEWGGGGNA